MEGSADDDTSNEGRLILEPLRVEHAQEMSELLNDRALHVFTGGRPASFLALRDRYSVQVAGLSPDGSQRWLNWVVRLRETGDAAGYVQATISGRPGEQCAELAWVIGSQHQGKGYAGEAVKMMLDLLRTDGVDSVRAHIHPDHYASNVVARRNGLRETTVIIDREMRWEGGL